MNGKKINAETMPRYPRGAVKFKPKRYDVGDVVSAKKDKPRYFKDEYKRHRRAVRLINRWSHTATSAERELALIDGRLTVQLQEHRKGPSGIPTAVKFKDGKDVVSIVEARRAELNRIAEQERECKKRKVLSAFQHEHERFLAVITAAMGEEPKVRKKPLTRAEEIEAARNDADEKLANELQIKREERDSRSKAG